MGFSLKVGLLCVVAAVAVSAEGPYEKCERQCAVDDPFEDGFFKALFGKGHKGTAIQGSSSKQEMCISYCHTTVMRTYICRCLLNSTATEDEGRQEGSAAEKAESVAKCVLWLQYLDSAASFIGYSTVFCMVAYAVVSAIVALIKCCCHLCGWNLFNKSST